jgi:outer membrane protein assembly factor BamD (BamD/ComL family)
VALFQIGFIYNNKLGNVDSARIAYEQFLAKFPQHELAPYAKFELDNLGKSPDTILAEQNPKIQKKK